MGFLAQVTCTFLDANPVLRAIGRPMTMRAAEQHGDAWTPNCRLPGRAIRQALQPFAIHRRNANVAIQALQIRYAPGNGRFSNF